MNIHEETLKIARNLIKKDPSLTDWIISKFPELKESEDERIRQKILFLYYAWRNNEQVNIPDKKEVEEAISWLEKQASNIDDANKEYWRGYREGKQEILDKYAELEKQGNKKSIWHNEDEEPKRDSLILLIMQNGTPVVAKIIEPNHTFNHGERWAYIDDLLEKQEQEPKKVSIWKHWKNGIAGNGEGKQIYLIKFGNTYNLSSCLSFECDYIELSELDNLMFKKQGEHQKFLDSIQVGDRVTRNEDGMLVNMSQLERVAKKEEPHGNQLTPEMEDILNEYIDMQNNSKYPCKDCLHKVKNCHNFPCDRKIAFDEQKSANKIEPKFHEGDWIICCDYEPVQIISIGANTYYEMSNGDSRPCYMIDDNPNIRLWTIQDAKDGDVLATKKGNPFIYDKNRYNNGLAYSYAGLNVNKELTLKSPHHMLAHFGELRSVSPATKEQRDTLMKAMNDAGYTFDFERKELKKIEEPENFKNQVMSEITDLVEDYITQKPAEWSEEDENEFNHILNILTSVEKEQEIKGYNNLIGTGNWLKSIKDRVQSQPKQEWSEGDKKKILLLEALCDDQINSSTSCSTMYREMHELKNWLKSLRPQNWTKEDKERYISCLQRLGTGNPEQPETINSKWFKEHVYPQTTWKPSEKQLECLDYAIEKAEIDWSPMTNNRIYLTLKELKKQLEKL